MIKLTKPISGFLLSSLILSFGISFLNPVISLYLVDEKGISPFYMGIFISILMFLKIVTGHISGIMGDRHNTRRQILLFSQLCNIAGVLGFIFFDAYWLLLLIVTPLLALGAMGASQLFALGRLYTFEDPVVDATTMITWMRSIITFAWIIGPPIAFYLIDQRGFTDTLLMVIVFSVLVAATMILFVPDFETTSGEKTTFSSSDWIKNRSLVAILIANLLANLANNSYNIIMPLYITDTLTLNPGWIGILFGVTAAFEIVFMLASNLVSKISKEKMIALSFGAGAIYYTGLLAAQSLELIVVLQIFNGAFIGITTAFLLILIQDKMPEQAAFATSLYTNSMRVGNLLSGLIAGTLSEILGFQSVFVINAGIMLSGIIFIIISEIFAKPKTKKTLSETKREASSE